MFLWNISTLLKMVHPFKCHPLKFCNVKPSPCPKTRFVSNDFSSTAAHGRDEAQHDAVLWAPAHHGQNHVQQTSHHQHRVQPKEPLAVRCRKRSGRGRSTSRLETTVKIGDKKTKRLETCEKMWTVGKKQQQLLEDLWKIVRCWKSFFWNTRGF